jgi:hypothetical protein
MSNFNFPKLRVCDANGNGLVGAKLYFFEVGTTTPKDTYQDYDLVTPNTNPVVTVANGFTPPVFLAADGYKIVATDVDDVALAGYSCDEYWPSRNESSGKISATSGDTDPAVLGTNTSSGPGVKAVSSGTGHALWVEGDTSSPAKAALHVVPQDNPPSSPVKGDLYPSSVGGGWKFYDGTAWNNVVGQRYITEGDEVVSAAAPSPADFVTKYTIPANSLIAGSGLRVKAGFTVTAQVGTPDLTIILYLDGNEALRITETTTFAGHGFYIDAFFYVLSTGVAGVVKVGGVGVTAVASGSGGECNGSAYTSHTIDTTADNDISFAAERFGGTSASVKMEFLVVDIA